MKSRLQGLGSLGLPKLTDWQQKESASKTMTAQSSSMVHQGGKAMGKGRQGRAQPHVQSLLYRLQGTSWWQSRDSIFFPEQPRPSLLLAAILLRQPKYHWKFFVHVVPAPSSVHDLFPLQLITEPKNPRPQRWCQVKPIKEGHKRRK